MALDCDETIRHDMLVQVQQILQLFEPSCIPSDISCITTADMITEKQLFSGPSHKYYYQVLSNPTRVECPCLEAEHLILLSD